MSELDTPVARLNRRELTDEEVEKIANYTKPSWAGPHASAVVPVVDEGDHIRIGDPTTFEGGQHPNWSDAVLGTFGAGGRSAKQVRRHFEMFKSRFD